jgi:hypothetical protein
MIAIAAIQFRVVAWQLNYTSVHSNLVLRQLKEKAKERFIYILRQGSVFSLTHLIFKKINQENQSANLISMPEII